MKDPHPSPRPSPSSSSLGAWIKWALYQDLDLCADGWMAWPVGVDSLLLCGGAFNLSPSPHHHPSLLFSPKLQEMSRAVAWIFSNPYKTGIAPKQRKMAKVIRSGVGFHVHLCISRDLFLCPMILQCLSQTSLFFKLYKKRIHTPRICFGNKKSDICFDFICNILVDHMPL